MILTKMKNEETNYLFQSYSKEFGFKYLPEIHSFIRKVLHMSMKPCQNIFSHSISVTTVSFLSIDYERVNYWHKIYSTNKIVKSGCCENQKF